MEFKDVMQARYSCRRFLPTPVAEDTVRELVALAQRVPSWGNTQPWRVHAAGGQTALAIRQGLVAALTGGQAEEPEVPMPPSFEGALMERYRGLGIELFKVLGIGREDKDKRSAHYANNFNAFGAPALVFVTVPAGQTPYVVLDAGAFTAALCLAASERGLATCVLAALARYPQVVRRHLPLAAGERLVIGVALGYPDTQAPVNGFRSSRAGLAEVLTLTGF
ncbi:MAG: nitroreductase [Desulfarculus sp.]|nr:nitroreductase [Desulfarculus sp.]